MSKTFEVKFDTSDYIRKSQKTINELRALHGLPPLKKGDNFYISI